MSRILSEVPRRPATTPSHENQPDQTSRGGERRKWLRWAAPVCLLVIVSGLARALHPFGLSGLTAGATGLLVGIAISAAEWLLEGVRASGLIGATLGLLAGLLIAVLTSALVLRGTLSASTKDFLVYAMLFAFAYLGVNLGSRIGKQLLALDRARSPGFAAGAADASSTEKLLDTSVLIDGRIADICETHFLDGPLLVPQFVLKELQLVADSSDTLKRQRGRRGLEVLQRMQKIPHLQVRIVEGDAPQNADVDQKLIELALRLGAKIVTNDFNLNKVASVQGIGVLNVNELANALRPAVLPGEAMHVFILREGKEANQGVAYLEDGTMVVVDGARRLINRTVDIMVTSVHQTPAGKMIFGRLDERSEQGAAVVRQAAMGSDRGSRAGFSGGGES
jgi:uncharacterized protein YacL